MKKCAFGSVLILVSLVLAGCGGRAPKKLSVATDATWPPFESVDETSKQIVGFDIDLFKAIAAKEGLDLEFKNVGFDPLLAGMAQCQYDAAISAITITDERRNSMGFSDPYFAAGQVITIRADDSSITNKDDLAGKTAGTQIGTTGAMEVQKISGATLKTYDTVDLAFQDLMNGQVDAVVADNPLALGYVAKNADKIKTVGPVFTNEDYGIAVCKSNADLLAKINKGLAAVKAEGMIDSLTKQWIGPGK